MDLNERRRRHNLLIEHFPEPIRSETRKNYTDEMIMQMFEPGFWMIGDKVEARETIRGHHAVEGTHLSDIAAGEAGCITKRYFGDQAPFEIQFGNRFAWVFPEHAEEKLRRV